jgi:hypothetical protein
MKAAGLPFIEVSDFCQMPESCVMGILRDGNTGSFIFGPASNTVGQVRSFLSLTPGRIGREFTVAHKGDFWIYVFTRN